MNTLIKAIIKEIETGYQIELKIIMKMIEIIMRLREQARDKYRNLSEEKIEKKENMGGIDTTICLKKRNKY